MQDATLELVQPTMTSMISGLCTSSVKVSDTKNEILPVTPS